MSWTDQFICIKHSLLAIFVANRLYVGIELLLSLTMLTSIISQRTLEIDYPFIILASFVMPSIEGSRQTILLRIEVRYILFDYLIRRIFHGCLKREAYCSLFGSE